MNSIHSELMDAIQELDRRAEKDTVDSLRPWLRHLDGCADSPCKCGLSIVLAAILEHGA